jgi:hypothetical protein
MSDLFVEPRLQIFMAATAQRSGAGVEKGVILTGMGLVTGAAVTVDRRLMGRAAGRFRHLDIMAVGTQGPLTFQKQPGGFRSMRRVAGAAFPRRERCVPREPCGCVNQDGVAVPTQVHPLGPKQFVRSGVGLVAGGAGTGRRW